ncbi:phytoene/squalene synthetase [Bradyrhizobium sp. JR6.1]
MFAGKPTPNILAAIDQLADEAQGHLKTAFGLLADVPSGVRPIFLPLAHVRRELNRVRRADYDPFLPKPASRLRTLWTLWRAARTEEFGR